MGDLTKQACTFARVSVPDTYRCRFYAQMSVLFHSQITQKPAGGGRAAGRRAGADRRKGTYASNSWDRTTAEHGAAPGFVDIVAS